MGYIIDGHNLIHALPGITLDDEHDEVKLVLKLKGFFARIGKKAEVIFDGGLPGGVSQDLSSTQVKVTFASAFHSDADTLIKKRIRDSRDPRQLSIVSSDHAVLNAAAARQANTMTSQEFVAFMDEVWARALEKPANDDVTLSSDDVDYWLNIFSGE